MSSFAKTKVVAHSVAQLVSIRCSNDGEAWKLSLVQRGAVWEAMKVRYLLDSLLCGYPIGSLLLCRVDHGGSVLVEHGGLRRREAADASVLQLLDGQQRMNALAQLFSQIDEASTRFLVQLDATRDLEDVKRRRSALDRSLKYIREWDGHEPIDERWRWLDLSGFHRASLAGLIPKGLTEGNNISREEMWALLERIDPQCVATRWTECSSLGQARAEERARRLLHAWQSKSVPVLELALDGPTDVLQVFNRVNRTGTPVSNDDMFFAAVRTQWVDAEEHVERVRRRSPLLTRLGTLRLVARLARHRLEGADLLPLDVERLGGDTGRQLIREMERITREDGKLVERIEQISLAALRHSGIGHGLRVISGRLFDPVFAWAVARDEDTIAPSATEPAWAFLMGATCFQYRTIFREPFERLAFALALEAGRDGMPFPLKSIVQACHKKWPGLRRGRQRVAEVGDDDARRRLVNKNRALLLRIAQRLPFELREGHAIDVEHLYPQAKMIKMKWWDADHTRGRLVYHPDAWSVNRAGNLYLLDASLNRAAQDDWPHEKLPLYRKAEWTPDLFLSPSEETKLLSSCELIRNPADRTGPSFPHASARIAAAMNLFTGYVRSRELRIFGTLRESYPMALSFAAKEAP